MDPSGKLIYTRNTEVLSANLATVTDDQFTEGARIPLSTKELGTSETFATSLMHSPNGRFVTVVGDGEYIIYTALAWRNKAFGSGSSFAWAGDSNTYAVLEGKLKVRMYKNFRERSGAGMKGAGSWAIESLHGGVLLGARGPGFVVFWDWETGEVVRRIDVDSKNVSDLKRRSSSRGFSRACRFTGQALAALSQLLLMSHSTSYASTETHTMQNCKRVLISGTRVLRKRLTSSRRSTRSNLVSPHVRDKF